MGGFSASLAVPRSSNALHGFLLKVPVLGVLGPPHLLEQRIRDRGISTHESGGSLVAEARLASPAARPRLVHEAVGERRSAGGAGRLGPADEHPTFAVENLEGHQEILDSP